MTVGFPNADGTVPTIPCVYYSGTTFARQMPATSGTYDLTLTYTWEFVGGPIITGSSASDGSSVSFQASVATADAIPNGTAFLLIATSTDGTRLPYGTGKWKRVIA